MLQKIVRVVLEAPIDKSFDYLYQPTKVNDAIPEVGQLVAVPFGRRTVVGLVIGTGDSSDVPVEKLKAVAYCFHEIPPFDKAWMDLCRFVASYYHRTLGEVAINVLPKMIRQNKQKSIQKALKVIDEPAKGSEQQSEEAPELNEDQQQAVEAITAAEGFSTFLLYGVTGSGKTEVYLRAVADKLASSSDGQVLLMVPEINLTPQLEERIRSRFPHEHIALQHSGLTERERLRDWLAIMTGRARIILGTRLSVMTPAPKLRMIVVDEEHDPSYKQQEGVRYSARDLAVWRANYLKIPVVLGSATPSLESWHHAKSGRYRELALPERARENAAHPEVTLIDTSKDKQVDGLSQTLVDAIEKRIEKGEISLLFLNRRGFAPVIICNACGWMSTCHRCSAYMVFHKANRILRCHHCGLERRIPKVCPDCGNVDLQALGRGTQRIEENIRLRFPQARILRIDADSTSRKGALQEALDAIYRGDVDIVIGTQMIAKGHDFQNLTLVGVLEPDAALFSHDFRASERLFAQLMQVAGRAGRDAVRPGANPSQVLIQTRYPSHPLYQAMRTRRYDAYVSQLMDERHMAGFPPFGFQALLMAEAKDISKAMMFLQQAKVLLGHREGLTVSDAIPMAIMRVADIERAQLLIESASRPVLQAALTECIPQLRNVKANVRWTIEVDPLSI